MSRPVLFYLVIAFFLISSSSLKSQESYFPPPAAINYDNGTLTIFPPDSLPCDPVVLLGYNMLVDSVFYDNVMVENQNDTIVYIFDYSTLNPGNHVFCVTAVYNLWISDLVCDSALVIYGFELPFFEDWTSGNFTQNQWHTESGNWTVETEEGNPGPAAFFSGMPAHYNYEIPLTSFSFRGDLFYFGIIFLNFDIKLASVNSTGNEKIFVQCYNSNNLTWRDVGIYSNGDGSFNWIGKRISLVNTDGGGPAFKIRFVARGVNSADINNWIVDNIHLDRLCMQGSSLAVFNQINYLKVDWMGPDGCGPRWMEWDEGENGGNSIGTGSAVEFSVAARWTPIQLHNEGIEGYPISKIAFFPAESYAEYSIGIWQGDSVVELVYEQPVINPIIAQWDTINVDSIVLIDATKDLYIGYKINAFTGYPAGTDGGPPINGYGNMIYWQNTWQTLLEVNSDLPFNWNIAWLPGPDPDDPESRFLIYRQIDDGDFQHYGTTLSSIYTDYNIESGHNYCYKVTMEWFKANDTCESPPTNTDCEMILATSENSKECPIAIYPNPTSDNVTIKSVVKIEHLQLYSILGDLVFEKKILDIQYTLDVSGLKRGVYFLEAIAGGMLYRKKILIN